MRFLVDQNLSPILVEVLAAVGHDVVHVRSLGLSRAKDEAVMAAAQAYERVLISADTDFGELLARSNADRPSVLLLRRQPSHRAVHIAALIAANLDAVAEDLATGAIVVLDGDRIRIRRLPLVEG